MTNGEVFEALYPFVRSTYESIDVDEEGISSTELPTWKPGTRNEGDGYGNCWSEADAVGRIVLTVVSVHKPGRFPERVFFTRQWVDPDGKAFGKSKCRVAVTTAFRTLARGYRHPFCLKDCECDGCEWPHNDHRMRGWTEHARSVIDADSAEIPSDPMR